jgi:predicted metal-dependent HD superfamily phosphohydrolase
VSNSPTDSVPPASASPLRDQLLEARFNALWHRCRLPGSGDHASQIWKMLARRYSESHRFYHDQSHLAHCLEQLDLARAVIDQPDQVEMAIWFHDLVNDPGDRTNEARSADKFRAVAEGVMDTGFTDGVAALIMATTHRERPTDPDQQFICDIDLTSFGCPWECFMRDSDAVKAEFPGSEEEYYRGKKMFLEQLLARPRIFLTDFFHQRYEDQARSNIERLLELIGERQA